MLQPAHIDQFTCYRYYTGEQLPRIHRIMALKELGLSLEQDGLLKEGIYIFLLSLSLTFKVNSKDVLHYLG